MKKNIYEELTETLKKNEKYISEEGKLLKANIYSDAMTMDKKLIELLMTSDDIKNKFFVKIGDTYVFDKQGFTWFIESKEFLPDSYTAYENEIGLASDRKSIVKAKDVVLDFPYKDCVLEGGQTKEEQKREEIFYNDIIASDEITRMLKPKMLTSIKKYSKGKEETDIKFDDKDNLFIKGNNLIAMSSVLERYEGRVKCIYIDPPYNTGNDSFGYNDSFNHSTWLTFMKNRLELASKLLSPEGAIFVQCSGIEIHYLKVLMDEIMKRDNYVTTITCKVKSSGGLTANDSMFFDCSEYIIVYAKSYADLDYNFVKTPVELIDKNSKTVKNYNQIITDIDYSKKQFICEKDGMKYYRIPEGNFKIERLNISEMEPQDFYEKRNEIYRLTALSGGIGKKLREHTKEFMNDDDLFVYEYTPTRGRDAGKLMTYLLYKNSKVSYLNNYIEVDDKNKTITKLEGISNILDDDLWQGIASEGNVKLNNAKKPEKLIETILSIAANPGDIVMDFFAGSGTTLAVAHKLKMQYIGIEQLDAHCEMAVERLKNVINGEKGGISKSVKWNGGGSFIYCELMENSQQLIDKIMKATKSNINEVKEQIYNDDRIVPYIMKKDLFNADNEFNALKSLNDKKNVLLSIIDKNKLYVNYSDKDDESYNITDIDRKFTDSFYEEV